MQDRYAGDVGDFGKYALLRALGPGRALVLYHHQTRRARAVRREVPFLRRRLQAAGFDGVEAVRLRPYSGGSTNVSSSMSKTSFHRP